MKWKSKNTANGYQIQLYDGTKKVKTYTKTGSTGGITLNNIVRNKFYKVRVRTYMLDNVQKVYGDYSNWYYFAQQPKLSLKSTSKGVHVSWSKVSGATDYSVYVSTKNGSGYKMLGTTTKTKMTAQKYGKSKMTKGKTYYFYVVANQKDGSKTFTSSKDDRWSAKY